MGKGKVVTKYFGGKNFDEEKMLKASETKNKDFSQLDENEQVSKAQKRVKQLFPEGNMNKILEIYFHKLIALCKSKNLEIIILTLPMTDAFMNSYKTQYDPQWFEKKRNEIQLQYPELQFMDLRGKLSAQHFNDSDHLNLSGAQVADDYIRQKLI